MFERREEPKLIKEETQDGADKKPQRTYPMVLNGRCAGQWKQVLGRHSLTGSALCEENLTAGVQVKACMAALLQCMHDLICLSQ